MWRLGTSLRLGIIFSILFYVLLATAQQGFWLAATLTKPMTGYNLYYLALASLGRLAPYLERDCLRSLTPAVSKLPRTIW